MTSLFEDHPLPVVEGVSDEEYFAYPAVDQTALKRFMVSPLAYADYLENGVDATQDVLDFGTAMHSLVLGSGPRVAVRPDRRTKEGKLAAADLEGCDVVLLKKADYEKAQAMFPVPREYFKGIEGRAEVALIDLDRESGLLLKGKADWLPSAPDSDGVFRIRDYKTHGSELADFPRTAWQRGYHIQAAFYMRLARLCGFDGPFGFEFVVQEKKRPYDFMVWQVREDSPEIDLANRRIDSALRRMARLRTLYGEDWVSSVKTFGVDKSPRNVEFPIYALEREEMEVEQWQ